MSMGGSIIASRPHLVKAEDMAKYNKTFSHYVAPAIAAHDDAPCIVTTTEVIVVNLLPQPGVWLGFICALSTACVLLLSESRGVAPPETIGTAASDRSRREDEGEAAAAPPRPDAPLQKPSDV